MASEGSTESPEQTNGYFSTKNLAQSSWTD